MEVVVYKVISPFDKRILDIVCEDAPYSYTELRKSRQGGYLVVEKNRSLCKNIQNLLVIKDNDRRPFIFLTDKITHHIIDNRMINDEALYNICTWSGDRFLSDLNKEFGSCGLDVYYTFLYEDIYLQNKSC